MAFCDVCRSPAAHTAFLVDGRCVRCSELKVIADRQWSKLDDLLIREAMEKIEKDLDLLTKFDAYLAERGRRD